MKTNNNSGSNSLDARKILAWLIIVVAIAEWFPFFLQIVLNFFNFNLNKLPSSEIPFLLAFFLSPIIVVLLSIIGNHYRAEFKKFLRLAILPILIGTAIMSWICFAAFYQYLEVFRPDLSDLTPNSDIFGILGYLNPLPRWTLYLANAVIFYICIPFLFLFVTDGTGELFIQRETNWGLLVASLYFVFRPGGIVGSSFRFSILLVIVTTIWTILEILTPKFDNASLSGDQSEENLEPQLIQNLNISLGRDTGMVFLLAFGLSAPAIMMNGFLVNSWVWMGLFLSTSLVEYLLRKGKSKITSRVTLIFLISITFTQICLVWTTSSGLIVRIEPFLQFLNLFFVGLSAWAIREKIPDANQNGSPTHPLRKFWVCFWGILAVLFPFLTGLYTPVTNLIGTIVLGLFMGWTGLMRARRQKCRV